MRGSRAKDLRKIAEAQHDPQFADKINMMKFDMHYPSGKLKADGTPVVIKLPMVVQRPHPLSKRGTYLRAKKAYKQWKKAGAPRIWKGDRA